MNDLKKNEIAENDEVLRGVIKDKIIPALDAYAADLLRKDALNKPTFDEYAKPVTKKLADSFTPEELKLFTNQHVIKTIRSIFARQLRFMMSEEGYDQNEATRVFEIHFTAALVDRCLNSLPLEKKLVPEQMVEGIKKEILSAGGVVTGNLRGDDQGKGRLEII